MEMTGYSGDVKEKVRRLGGILAAFGEAEILRGHLSLYGGTAINLLHMEQAPRLSEDLDFNYRQKFAGVMPDAYQRLLLDVLHGDASLFARSDEVELAWGIIDPIQATWDRPDAPQLAPYEVGQWGPLSSTDWMRAQGREWFDACPVLH